MIAFSPFAFQCHEPPLMFPQTRLKRRRLNTNVDANMRGCRLAQRRWLSKCET